ncbi:hypothetical protein AMTR_s00037p00153530 [Amborella trichopoda]|uniref:Senescence regulator S40 n=2 Tax=Amborella trichopoda TaxID=13333 RepID=U5DAD6_AMBTC|nr:hypothetical protein AMTR_s00037p00153530 [Amborella trichopoda]
MANGYMYVADTRGMKSITGEDFEEEDMWAVFKENSNGSPQFTQKKSPVPPSRRISSAFRMIPRSSSGVALEQRIVVQQQSAPVNIPDWSKIYRNRGFKCNRMDDNNGDDGEDDDDERAQDGHGHEDEDDDDDDRIPPHEIIAKKLARNQISSFSVCEGFGRTLKGRDLSKVRNAVLTRTGFLE